jgi:hypothetical protein
VARPYEISARGLIADEAHKVSKNTDAQQLAFAIADEDSASNPRWLSVAAREDCRHSFDIWYPVI